jgi:hypothetical protein
VRCPLGARNGRRDRGPRCRIEDIVEIHGGMSSGAELTGQQPCGLPAGTGVQMLRGPAVVKTLDGLGRSTELLLNVRELGP